MDHHLLVGTVGGGANTEAERDLSERYMCSSSAMLLCLLPSLEEDSEVYALVLARFLILRGRDALGGAWTRLGARWRFDEEAETEVSLEGEGRQRSDVSVRGLAEEEEGGGGH